MNRRCVSGTNVNRSGGVGKEKPGVELSREYRIASGTIRQQTRKQILPVGPNGRFGSESARACNRNIVRTPSNYRIIHHLLTTSVRRDVDFLRTNSLSPGQHMIQRLRLYSGGFSTLHSKRGNSPERQLSCRPLAVSYCSPLATSYCSPLTTFGHVNLF